MDKIKKETSMDLLISLTNRLKPRGQRASICSFRVKMFENQEGNEHRSAHFAWKSSKIKRATGMLWKLAKIHCLAASHGGFVQRPIAIFPENSPKMKKKLSTIYVVRGSFSVKDLSIFMCFSAIFSQFTDRFLHLTCVLMQKAVSKSGRLHVILAILSHFLIVKWFKINII